MSNKTARRGSPPCACPRAGVEYVRPLPRAVLRTVTAREKAKRGCVPCACQRAGVYHARPLPRAALRTITAREKAKRGCVPCACQRAGVDHVRPLPRAVLRTCSPRGKARRGSRPCACLKIERKRLRTGRVSSIHPPVHGNPALRCNAAFPVPTRMRERVVAPALHGIEESGGPWLNRH